MTNVLTLLLPLIPHLPMTAIDAIHRITVANDGKQI
jgi:hypothetical protein